MTPLPATRGNAAPSGTQTGPTGEAAVLSPDADLRRAIEAGALAASGMCWTCTSCLAECPVNMATNRLQPMKIVWMANLGLLEELLALPQIWYCLSCDRCHSVCPNQVSPARLIAYLRREAVRRGRVAPAVLERYEALFARLHHARWHMVANCLESAGDTATAAPAADWRRWLEQPIARRTGPVSSREVFGGSSAFRRVLHAAHAQACFTCGECSSTCPVACGREVFDPVWIFRMANMGLVDELLTTPAIWLCLSCQRCTRACTQKVDGALLIHQLRKIARDEGFVDGEFDRRLRANNQALLGVFLDAIDGLFAAGAAAS